MTSVFNYRFLIVLMTTTIMIPLITSNAYAQQSHSLVANTYNIPADGTTSIPFTIPSGVANAYLSGTVLITGGILSTIDFSIVNTEYWCKSYEPRIHWSGKLLVRITFFYITVQFLQGRHIQ
jgi:hypothetical protein